MGRREGIWIQSSLCARYIVVLLRIQTYYITFFALLFIAMPRQNVVVLKRIGFFMFSFHLSCCVTVWRWLVVVESNFVYGNTATAVPHFIQEQGHKKRNKTQPQKDKGSVPSYRYLKRPLELEEEKQYWRFKISLYLFKRVSFRQANPTNRRDTSRRPKHFGKIHSDTDFKLKYFFSLPNFNSSLNGDFYWWLAHFCVVVVGRSD